MKILALVSLFFFVVSCNAGNESTRTIKVLDQSSTDTNNYQVAYFAAGCFWCVEMIFESVKGVQEVVVGYSGGSENNATYEKVSKGLTHHAEAVAVYYDSTIIDYPTLLVVFFASHDPTTLNQQGPDKGRQYRSVIFYTSPEEKKKVNTYINQLLEDRVFDEITTTVVAYEAFYPAEDYHQDYEKKNPENPYVKKISVPRLENFKKKHPELLK